MKINIDLIKPSPRPVRTQWDEEKMNELAQSIKEQGLIVPIKVRPVQEWIENCHQMQNKQFPMFCTDLQQYSLEKYGEEGSNYGTEPGLCEWCDYADTDEKELRQELENDFDIPANWKPYEIVYGHRRIEALRQAGLIEIGTIIEGVDDTGALIQALIENVQREDMIDRDKGYAIKLLKQETEKSYRELAKMLGLGRSRLHNLVALIDDPTADILSVHARGQSDSAANKARDIRGALGNDVELRKEVAEKVIREDLTESQTKRVAKAIAEAPTSQAKEKLLEFEYSPHIHDPEVIKDRAERLGAHDPLYQDEKPSPQEEWEKTPEVAMMLSGLTETIKAFTQLLKEIGKTTKINGKFAPEAKQFIAAKLRTFKNQIDVLLADLEA